MPSPQSFNLILYKRREEGVTDIQESLNALLVKYYNDLLDSQSSGRGRNMKSHTSMLETFFVYTMALWLPIFKKKSSRRFLEKTPKLFIDITDVTLQQ